MLRYARKLRNIMVRKLMPLRDDDPALKIPGGPITSNTRSQQAQPVAVSWDRLRHMEHGFHSLGCCISDRNISRDINLALTKVKNGKYIPRISAQEAAYP
jgi:hypothetical protein